MANLLEDRVGHLEASTARLSTEVAVLSRDVSDVKTANQSILQGVNALREEGARRGEGLSWKTVVTTIVSTGSVIGMLSVFVWWFIASSPSVQNIERRVTRIDDRDIGHIHGINRRLDQLERNQGWHPQIQPTWGAKAPSRVRSP
jgi:hypothetical protein